MNEMQRTVEALRLAFPDVVDDEKFESAATHYLNQPPMSWDDTALENLSMSFVDYCKKLHAAGVKDVANVARANLSNMEMGKSLRETSGGSTLRERFRAWVGVHSGEVQNDMALAISASHPTMKAKTAATKAKRELELLISQGKVTDKNIVPEDFKDLIGTTRAWRTYFSDDKMVELMHRHAELGDEDARKILHDFMKRRMGSISNGVDECQRLKTDAFLRQQETPGFASPTKEQLSDLMLPLTEPSPDDSSTNVLGQSLKSKTSSGERFLAAYVQNKSAGPDRVHADLTGDLVGSLERSVAVQVEFERVPGNGDIAKSRLSGADDFNPAVYLERWQTVLGDSTLDLDRALARKHEDLEVAVIEKMSGDLGLTGEEIGAISRVAVDPTTTEVMRLVMTASNNGWFRQTESQVCARYDHDGAARKEESRAKKKRRKGGGGGDVDGTPFVRAFPDKVAHIRTARTLPELSRQYLSDFYRARVDGARGERDCRNGENCYCMASVSSPLGADESNRKMRGFICRELLMPGDVEVFMAMGKLPGHVSLCFFCEIFTITTKQDEISKSCVEPIGVLQRFSVSIGPGQFNKDCMLTVGSDLYTGIVAPIIRFSTNLFVYSTCAVGSLTLPCMQPTDRLDFRHTFDRRIPI